MRCREKGNSRKPSPVGSEGMLEGGGHHQLHLLPVARAGFLAEVGTL